LQVRVIDGTVRRMRALSVALTRWRDHRDAPAIELSAIMEDRLRALGHHPFVVHDGDGAALESDCLILFGDGRSFPRFRRLLRHRATRPRIALWQFDPLPPTGLLDRAERLGLAAARLSLALDALPRIGGLSWYRFFQRWLPWPLFRASAGAARDLIPAAPPRVRDLRGALESWGWIRRAWNEGWLDALYMSTGQRVHFLEARGVPSSFAPLGCAPGLGEDRGPGSRDIDVIFLGGLKRAGRRAERWEPLRRKLEEAGLRVTQVLRDCYGEERTALLNRARVLVHLHKLPWDTPWMRWVLATSCGVLVVSEPLGDPDPLRPGVDYVEAPASEMAAAIQARLADRSGSARMVASCEERLRDRMSMDASLRRVLGAASGS
jgi:hypothetical protein